MGVKNIIFFLPIVECFMGCLAATFTNFTDESALLAFRAHITSDPNNILATNWSQGTSFCNWSGISCSQRHQRVISINLPNMGLSGTIPRDIRNLSFLAFLDISNNSLHGSLPDELGLLPRMKLINLKNNGIDGNIPRSLGNLTKLEELYLDDNNLDGPIPNEITHLVNLQVLSFTFNRLTGAIPQAIFNISSLRFIGFTYNSLHGTLPMDMCNSLSNLTALHLAWNQLIGRLPTSLTNCTELQVMSLALNNFTGTITDRIGELSKLEVLYLDSNDFTGTIPTSIGNLSLLEDLDIAENHIYGNIPHELGRLFNLINLRLSSNNLKGEIAESIFNITKLEFISVVENQLSGSLPSTLGLWLPNLEKVFLGRNKFSGIIPRSMSNASKLNGIELSENSFMGNVPKTLANLGNLEYLNIGENQLTNDPSTPELGFLTLLTNCRRLKTLVIGDNPLSGTLPKSIGNLSVSLEGFYATSCGLKGIIPDEIGNLTNLVVLGLGDNNLEGPIPTTLGRLWKLQQFQISKSAIEGPIPSEICSLKDLGKLLIMENKLSGPIPGCIGNLTSLRELNLYSNGLTSELPSSLWSLVDLIALNLSSNFLSGSLAPEVENLKSIIQLELSSNQFTGNIPSTIGQLQKLLYLSLSRNRLEGSIPESFANFLSLEYLYLSENALYGMIPKSLEKLLYLKSLNVSFNKLSGEIPSGGPFVNFTAESFMSNERLCGPPKFNVLACNSQSRGESKTQVPLKYILPPIAALAIAGVILIWFVYRGKNKQLPVSVDLPLGHPRRRVSYYELLHATNEFSEENLIGKGSLGTVYKGFLSNGMVAAVKVFDLEIQGAFKSFDTECEVMRNLRHRNLVKVINSCSSLDFKALVLEYMPNGNLERWLHSDTNRLDIVQRLRVMIDVASALEYMHHGYSTTVVHCDLKPSNILLDEDMVAHVADFGIAKLFTEKKLTTQTKTLGTIGYMAPEYGSAGIVSTMSDVYSYGTLLMETFTRKKPTDDIFLGALSLRCYVYEAFPHAITEIADANLLTSEEKIVTATKDCLLSIMGLALKCTVESPDERVDIKDVLVKLEKIKNKLHEDVTGT